MKKISIVVRQSFLAVTICIFAYAPLIHAVDIQRARIQEKVILHVAWGSGKGRIGEVPGRLEGTPGESINPIAVDSKGNIYVADSVHYRVQKYNSQGNFQSEINLKNLDEWPYKNIPDICVDSNDNIYIALLKKQQIVQFSPGGKLISTFDISKAGVLERNVKGDVKLNVRKNFRIKRIIVDKIGSIYVLGSEDNVLKLDPSGQIIQRWGPYASNAIHFLFLDDSNNLYIWMPPKENNTMYKRYDSSGKFLGDGLGAYDQIIAPFYFDSTGNVYGFALKDNALAVYNHKNKRLSKLSLNGEILAFERWTIDSSGNIYYTREGEEFEIVKISLLHE